MLTLSSQEDSPIGAAIGDVLVRVLWSCRVGDRTATGWDKHATNLRLAGKTFRRREITKEEPRSKEAENLWKMPNHTLTQKQPRRARRIIVREMCSAFCLAV